ncbi:hypothetical protein [Nocardia sp. NRRL WC-3656]|uniref:hypothetical protein n=1 Tax=Nocardia sp. NRRL WC-3656 TaxID=1463824 RepID=UPI0004C46C06|nr:hypothetical protein [Nocardia sp. NRRL WC-3656]
MPSDFSDADGPFLRETRCECVGATVDRSKVVAVPDVPDPERWSGAAKPNYPTAYPAQLRLPFTADGGC